MNSVLVEHHGQVAIVRLNRPDALNAMSAEMRRGLADALDKIESRESVRAIVLTGSGRAFSAGGDLNEFQSALSSGRYDAMVASVAEASDILARYENTRLPVIGAVNGVAVAGGLELMLCCDMIVAAESAKIGDGHLKYGVLPGGGGSIRLARKLPANIAKELLLTAKLFPAEKFAQWGLVNHVVPDAELMPFAMRLAQDMAALSPLALSEVKALANFAPQVSLKEGLKAEITAFARYVVSQDFREGTSAFVEKRTPSFVGR